MKPARTPEHIRASELHLMQLNFDRNVTAVELAHQQALTQCAIFNVRPFWPQPERKVVPKTRHEVLNLELVKS